MTKLDARVARLERQNGSTSHLHVVEVWNGHDDATKDQEAARVLQEAGITVNPQDRTVILRLFGERKPSAFVRSTSVE